MIPNSYKNSNAGKSGILFATGPTLNSFSYDVIEEPLSNVIKFGVNSSIYKDELDFDIFFGAQDVSKEREGHPHSEIEKNNPIFKKMLSRADEMQFFLGTVYNGKRHKECFDKDQVQALNATEFSLTTKKIYADISINPCYNYSISFPCIQFMLYSGIKTIYLVGCDCSGAHSYIVSDTKPGLSRQVFYSIITKKWVLFSKFIKQYYPDVEVISINPVGLKDLFTDKYI